MLKNAFGRVVRCCLTSARGLHLAVIYRISRKFTVSKPSCYHARRYVVHVGVSPERVALGEDREKRYFVCVCLAPVDHNIPGDLGAFGHI